jgi:hypothetical protein
VTFTVIDQPNPTTPQQPNNPAPRTGPITSLTLMNAVDDVAFRTLRDNDSVSYRTLNCWGLTLKAETNASVGSIRWGLDSNANVNTENYAPYAIGGDVNGSDLVPFQFSTGTHTVTVTAFSERGGAGSVLDRLTMTFTVVDQPL